MSAPVVVPSEASPPPASTRLHPAIVVVLLGSFMASLDTTMFGLALPQIGRSFGVTDGVAWLVTAKLLAVGAVLPMSGWLADRFGRKRTYSSALWCFAIAAGCAAIAPTFQLLLVCRVFQGFSTGVMMPVGMAMLMELTVRERQGRVLALWAVSNQLAPAFGPPVGGLVTQIDWRWVFVLSALVALVCSLIGARILPNVGYHDPTYRLDVAGVVLSTLGLLLLVFGLNESRRWGLLAPETVACVGIGFTVLAVFVVHELRARDPILEVRLFRHAAFAISIVILAIINGVQFSRLIFVPLNLQEVRGMRPSEVGILFLVPALLAIVATTFAGRVTDRSGPRRPIILGTALMTTALLGFGNLGLDWPVVAVLLLLCVQSVGFGIASPPVVVSGMSELEPAQLAQGAAIRAVVGQVGSVVTVSVMSAVVAAGSTATDDRAQAAYNRAFFAAALLAAGALALAIRLPRRSAPSVAPAPMA